MTSFAGLSAFPLTLTDEEGQSGPRILQYFLDRIVAAGAERAIVPA